MVWILISRFVTFLGISAIIIGASGVKFEANLIGWPLSESLKRKRPISACCGLLTGLRIYFVFVSVPFACNQAISSALVTSVPPVKFNTPSAGSAKPLLSVVSSGPDDVA